MSLITIIRVNKTKADKGYDVIEMAYKTEDGKTKGMKVFPFGDQKEVAAVAAAAKPGDVLEAVFKQNEKGFWNFGSLKATSEKPADKPAAVASRGTWETPEERKERQGFIVRQSSLSNAIAFCEAAKIKPTVSEVVDIACDFEEFVMTGHLVQKPMADIS